MSASVPIINAGLARLPDAKENLAAFGLAFALGILLESPVFALQQAAIAWYGGVGPVRGLVGYAAGVGAAVAAVMAAVAYSPAAIWILTVPMGADASLAEPAARALRVAVAFPVFIAVRSALQAILIARRRSAPIGWGTLLRLSALAALIFLVTPRFPEAAPAAAMACLALAVIVETSFVALCVPGTPERAGETSPAQVAGRTFGGRTRFALPLMGMMTLGTLTNPLINAFIARTADPATGLAAYAVIASLVWFLASPFLRYSSVTIALGSSREHLARLGGFVWRGVGLLCGVLILAHFTPLWAVLLRDGIGLADELAAQVRPPLVFLSLQPLVAGFIAYHQGLLTRDARTRAVGMGGVARVVAILVGGSLGLAAGLPGALLGGMLLGLSFLAELILLALARRRGA